MSNSARRPTGQTPPERGEDPFAFCRENPDALREVEQYARETGRDAFADACLNVLKQIGAVDGGDDGGE